MKLPEKEKAAQRAAFRAMSPGKKAEHIFTYYKWPILLGLIALAVLGSVVRRELTRKEPILSVAFVNVSFGDGLETGLSEGYLHYIGADPGKTEVTFNRGLYLSDDADVLNHEYAYASQIKIMGALTAESLDLMVMNREAWDFASRRGYLMELTSLLDEMDPRTRDALAPLLAENEVIVSDNTLDYLLGEAEAKERVTRQVPNALAVHSLRLFREAAPDGELYLAAAANSARREEIQRYLQYLVEE